MRNTRFALSLLVGAWLLPPSAWGQSCSTTKCTPTNSPKSYFCDVVCTGGSCTGSTDTCPGHCTANPGIECVNNGPCPVGDTCSFSTTVQYGHCSNQPEQACLTSLNCTNGGTCNFDSFYTGDGKVTLCGTNGNDTITGDDADNVICGNNGLDVLATGGGNNIVSGGNGADTIKGGPGDDVIHGDGSSDNIQGCGGRDVLHGDDDNDNVRGGTSCDAAIADDVVGSVYCGGAGDDVLWGVGPAHQCMDAGPGQLVSGSNPSDWDCAYMFAPGNRAQTALDVGTARNCARTTSAMESVSCACDD